MKKLPYFDKFGIINHLLAETTFCMVNSKLAKIQLLGYKSLQSGSKSLSNLALD